MDFLDRTDELQHRPPDPAIRVFGATCSACSGQELQLIERYTSRLECLSCGTVRLAAWTSHLMGIMRLHAGGTATAS